MISTGLCPVKVYWRSQGYVTSLSVIPYHYHHLQPGRYDRIIWPSKGTGHKSVNDNRLLWFGASPRGPGILSLKFTVKHAHSYYILLKRQSI